MASTRRFVLSTVGISMLSKSTDKSDRGRLWGAANDEILPDATQTLVAKVEKCARDTLGSGTVAERRKFSAELNGLYGLYDDRLQRGQYDQHILIVTDTALGRTSGEIVADFLKGQGWTNVTTYAPPHLSTATADDFSQGIKNLINWCDETIPGYQEAGYEIIFNLTGGFKSLQGYLTIVGMFYADRIVYIFESADELLTIPRLPIDLDESVFRDHRVQFALLSEGPGLLSKDQVVGVPDGLLESLDDHVDLSQWGLLAWNRLRRDLLSEDLLDFPRLRYAETFVRQFKKATPAEREALQRKLALVSALLQDNDGDVTALKRHSGLHYDNYTNQRTADGRPIGHFRLTLSRRVRCTMESDGMLLLRHFGEHAINESL